ncbi:lysophospholipid acyltransferase family protein [Mariniluteicoccus endophyticus]
MTVSTLSSILRHITRQEWQGSENIPQTGGAIFVVNHISNFDPLSYGHYVAFSGRYPRFLAKEQIFKVPGLGWVATNAGQIMVRRGGPQAAQSVEAAVEAVNAGKTVSIYPEGTITADPLEWPMTPKSGAARIALATGAPVIPVGQWGANHVMPGKKLTFPRLLPRKTMKVKAGTPVDLSDLLGRPATPETIAEASERIIRAITDIVAELRGEQPPTTRWNIRLGRREDPATDGAPATQEQTSLDAVPSADPAAGGVSPEDDR